MIVEPNHTASAADLSPVKLPTKVKATAPKSDAPTTVSVVAAAAVHGKTLEQVLTRDQIPPRENEKDEDMQLKKTMGSALAGAALIASALVPQAAKAADAEKGTLTGILTAKGEGWIEVKADDAKEAKRWSPRWIGGLPKDGGGFDKAVLDSFKKVIVPNRVKLDWVTEEGPRVVSVQAYEYAKSGTVEGEVTAKGENWVDVKAGDKPAERYSPRWTEGGADKDALRAISEVKAGDKVILEWAYNERLRIVSLKKQ